ncbi:MAG: site-2 protease family protein [Candidatus Anstonellales archaeon]
MLRKVVILLAIAIFYIIINLNIPGTVRFFAAVLELGVVGEWLRKEYKLDGEYGLFLLKSRKGINKINEVALRYERILKIFADVSIAVGFGLASFFVMKWRPVKERVGIVLAGLGIMILVSLLVSPFALGVIISTIGIKGVGETVSGEFNIIYPAMLLFTGFCGFISYSLVAHGIGVVSAVYEIVMYGIEQEVQEGATLLLPGINLPFLEGVFALALILIVHEGAHALLTRIARVRLLSSGIVFFGFIPVGAFVEPDENHLLQKSIKEQERVLAVGTGANFLASIVLLLIFLGFFYATKGFYEEGAFFYGILQFMYKFLGLAFALNFVVAVVNLLPVPFFDGYRMVELVVGKRIAQPLSILLLTALVINFLPALF